MIASMLPDEDTIRASRIFGHYDKNDFFLEENSFLKQAGALAKIPGVIVNGRFDMCTPSLGAFELHEAVAEFAPRHCTGGRPPLERSAADPGDHRGTGTDRRPGRALVPSAP